MKIGIPIYDQVDMLDVTGPFEMFDWAEFDVELIAETSGLNPSYSSHSWDSETGMV